MMVRAEDRKHKTEASQSENNSFCRCATIFCEMKTCCKKYKRGKRCKKCPKK
jgi:hypothetical protein